MTARVQITRKKLVTLDTTTLILTDADPSDDVIYEGRCRIRSLVARVQTADFEGQLLGQQQLILSLPVATSVTVRTGDEGTLLEGGDDPLDPDNPVRFRIQGRAVQTQATARRFPIEMLS